MPEPIIADHREVCIQCLAPIRAGDEIIVRGLAALHAECDPEATRCPHCDGLLP